MVREDGKRDVMMIEKVMVLGNYGMKCIIIIRMVEWIDFWILRVIVNVWIIFCFLIIFWFCFVNEFIV